MKSKLNSWKKYIRATVSYIDNQGFQNQVSEILVTNKTNYIEPSYVLQDQFN